MSSHRTPLLIVALVTLVGLIASDARAQFTSDLIARELVAPLDPVNVPDPSDFDGTTTSDVEGALIYEHTGNRTDFTIVVEGLPQGIYTVEIGGVFRGFLSSVATPNIVDSSFQGFSTFADLEFSTRQRGDRLLLNFEPRGELVEIRSVLDFVQGLMDPDAELPALYASGRLPFAVPVSENEEPEFNRVNIRDDLQVIDGSFADGQVRIKSNRRRTTAQFRFRNLVPGDYVLLADGMEIGALRAEGRGRGRLDFSTDPRGSQSLLVFDPTGVSYDLVRTGPATFDPIDLIDPDFTPDFEAFVALRTTVGSAEVPGGDLMPLGEARNVSASAGFDADGSATVEIDNQVGRVQLLVTLENVPVGSYTIAIENDNPFVEPGLFDNALATVAVQSLQPVEEEEETMDGTDGEGEGGGEGEEPSPMAPIDLGMDNNGEQTFGSALIATDGLTAEGADQDEFGNAVQLLISDEQGRRFVIIDNTTGIVYFRGRVPDSGFSVNPLLLPTENDDDDEGIEPPDDGGGILPPPDTIDLPS